MYIPVYVIDLEVFLFSVLPVDYIASWHKSYHESNVLMPRLESLFFKATTYVTKYCFLKICSDC